MTALNRHLALLTLVLAAPWVLAQEAFVPVTQEPHHRLVLETSRYRIYDVLIDAGNSTLMHQHDTNNFVVLLSDAQVTTEIPGVPATTRQAKAGIVNFTPASVAEPLVHKVSASGSAPFRNFLIELKQPASDAASGAEAAIDPAWTVVRESPRGKAYRATLDAGQSLKIPAGSVEPILVCITEGHLRHPALNSAAAPWQCKTGDFLLLEGADASPVVMNAGTAGLDVVLVAPR
jgi:hypothetical protein